MSREDSLDWLPPAPSTEQLQSGRELLREGLTFPQIRAEIVALGASHEVSRLAVAQLASDEAEHWLLGGKSPADVRSLLVERGLDPRDADEACRAAREKHGRRLYRSGVANGRLYAVAALVFVLGCLVAVMNEVGLLNLGPGAGPIVLLAALAIGFYALWQSRRRITE
jgi:hypothetical protein